MRKYLKSVKSGVILPYNERILMAGGVVVVTEKEAFPEKFAPVVLEQREQKVDLKVPEAAVAAPVSPELDAESTRRLKAPRMAEKRRPAIDVIAGLEGAF